MSRSLIYMLCYKYQHCTSHMYIQFLKTKMLSLSLFSPLLFVCLMSLGSTAAPTFTTKLIHYLSVDAPTLYRNLSMRELSYIDLERSIVRATHLANNNKIQFPLSNLETMIVAETNSFFALVVVGADLLNQRVYMDTGSSLLWFFCEPCIIAAPEPLFNPKDSSSFERENCLGTEVCSSTSPVLVECDGMTGCNYTIRYGKHGYSRGYLGRDSLGFSYEEDILEDVVFGCGKTSSIISGNGILGLTNNSLSLMGQMGVSKFAYCIGNISDRTDGHSKLIIGDEIKMMGSITSLIIQGHYYLSLDQIKIGEEKLKIDPRILRRDQENYAGGLLLDTGSTYSFFPRLVVKKFQEKLDWLIYYLIHPNSSIKYGKHPLQCYKGVISRDLRDFPIVQLKFEDGATMKLRAENIFRQFDNEIFCLAILPSDFLAINMTQLLFGNIMQQHFYFAYDLQQEELSFRRMDCAELDP